MTDPPPEEPPAPGTPGDTPEPEPDPGAPEARAGAATPEPAKPATEPGAASAEAQEPPSGDEVPAGEDGHDEESGGPTGDGEDVVAEAEEITEEAAGEKPASPLARPAPRAPTSAPAPAPAPGGNGGGEPGRKPGISLGGLAKPAKGTPLAVVTRVGILVVALILVAALIFGGIAVVNHLGSTGPRQIGTTPTPAASGSVSYINYDNALQQYTIDRPTTWTDRLLSGVTDTTDSIIAVGPPAPYPLQDLVVIQVIPLTRVMTGQDLNTFKTFIVSQVIGPTADIVSQNLAGIVNGMEGWTFTWSSADTANETTTLHNGYFLMDGDHMIAIILEVEPDSDTTSFLALNPIFLHMAQSIQSFYSPPSPTAGAGVTPTSTATPATSPSR